MTISSASSVQDSLQNSLSVDQIPEQEIQDYSSVQEQDASLAGPVFQDYSSPQKDLQKLEQRKKTEPGTWDKLKDGTEYARGYVEGLVSLNDLRNQVAAGLGIKNPLAESPYYLAGHESGKEDIKEGLTYTSGFTDGINPMTPIGDALAESLDIERQHAGKESTYWKGRSDGAAVGVMVDGAMMASGGEMMMGSTVCEVGSGGVCTIAAVPAFITGAVITTGGTVSMVSHAGMYAEAQQQYMQSRARESAGSSKTQAKPELSKPHELSKDRISETVTKGLTKEAQKGIQSLEKRIAEHEKKLAEFKANPTVRPGMEGQPKSVVKAAQESRIRHLEKEIQTFRENIKKLKGDQ